MQDDGESDDDYDRFDGHDEEPNPLDFYRSGRFDANAFLFAEDEWEECKEDRERTGSAKKKRKIRPFQARRSIPREDPKTSAWYRRYVEDKNKTWRDLSHPHGKLFMRRFVLPFTAIHEIIAKIREPEHRFWSEAPDAFGRASAPLPLLEGLESNVALVFYYCVHVYDAACCFL